MIAEKRKLFFSFLSVVLDLQAVTGLHMARVFHRDVKPGNMLIINNDLVLHDFDVSCLADSTAATLQMRAGTDAFWSPLWKPGVQSNR